MGNLGNFEPSRSTAQAWMAELWQFENYGSLANLTHFTEALLCSGRAHYFFCECHNQKWSKTLFWPKYHCVIFILFLWSTLTRLLRWEKMTKNDQIILKMKFYEEYIYDFHNKILILKHFYFITFRLYYHRVTGFT